MTGDHRADAALRLLAELPIPEPPPHEEARRRRQVVVALERLQSEAAATPNFFVAARRRPRWLTLSAAALVLTALSAMAFVSWQFAFSGGSPAARSGQAPPKTLAAANSSAAERSIATGSEVKTDPGASVQLKTALGARIAVAGSSELRLAGGELGTIERVELSQGSIRVQVPKLGPHRQFRVSTPDTLVIVHGTEFSVSVLSDEQGRTNTVVEVKSGKVEVRRKQEIEFLNAGAAWSSSASAAAAALQPLPPEPAESAKPAPVAKRAGETAARAKSESATDAVAETPAQAPQSNLARANALLSAALEASRRGDDKLALARLDDLLRRYPDSPVADNARVERFRTLRRLGRDREAARAAEGYLKGAPDGLARDEARELGK